MSRRISTSNPQLKITSTAHFQVIVPVHHLVMHDGLSWSEYPPIDEATHGYGSIIVPRTTDEVCARPSFQAQLLPSPLVEYCRMDELDLQSMEESPLPPGCTSRHVTAAMSVSDFNDGLLSSIATKIDTLRTLTTGPSTLTPRPLLPKTTPGSISGAARNEMKSDIKELAEAEQRAQRSLEFAAKAAAIQRKKAEEAQIYATGAREIVKEASKQNGFGTLVEDRMMKLIQTYQTIFQQPEVGHPFQNSRTRKRKRQNFTTGLQRLVSSLEPYESYESLTPRHPFTMLRLEKLEAKHRELGV